MPKRLSPQDELREIAAERAQIAKREQRLLKSLRTSALRTIRQTAIANGLTSEDVIRDLKRRPITADDTKPLKRRAPAKAARPPKFKDPKTGATWSGMGKPPKWAAALKAAGRLEKARIKK